MKIMRVLLNAAIVALVIFGAMLTLPKLAGIEPNIVLSGSMEPEIKTGGIVFTDTKDVSPEVGDVITYTIKDQQVTHRVVSKRDGMYITKGDANDAEDASPVAREQVIGTVSLSIPYLGFIASALTHKGVVLLVAALFVLSILLDSLCDSKIKNQEDSKIKIQEE